jgi:hypothetical protein
MILDASEPEVKSAPRNRGDRHTPRRSLTIERLIHPLRNIEPDTWTRHGPALDLFRE